MTAVPMKTETPEHEKLVQVIDKAQCIGEFLDWLSTQGIRLAFYGKNGSTLVPDYTPIQVILARFFDISLPDLELERRSMLKELAGIAKQERGPDAEFTSGCGF